MTLAFDTTPSSVTPDTAPTDFPVGESLYQATTLNDEEWPGRGILKVYRGSYANLGVTQELRTSGHIFTRYAAGSSWSGWEKIDKTAV